MYVHVIRDDPQAAEEAAPDQEAAAREALVAEAAKTLCDYLGRGGALGSGRAADEVHREVQDLPVGAEPRRKEGRIVRRDDL